MELRNRTIGEDNGPEMEDEEEALIEPAGGEGDAVKNSENKKSGIAGDERNILVLLFLYILQVRLFQQLSIKLYIYFCRAYHWDWQQLYP